LAGLMAGMFPIFFALFVFFAVKIILSDLQKGQTS